MSSWYNFAKEENIKKVLISQFIVLLVGTLFAWINFTRELAQWINTGKCPSGCVVGVHNPFLTSCFYGAIIFSIALVLSAVLLKDFKKSKL